MLETLTSTIRVGSSFLPWCWWKKWWKKSCNHLRIADLTLYISWIPLDTGTHLPVLVPVGVPFRKTLLRDGEFFPPIRWNHVTEGPGTSIFKKYSATSNQPTTTNLQEKKTPSWKTQPQCGCFISSIHFRFPRFAPTTFPMFSRVFGSFFFGSYRRMFPPQRQGLGIDSKRLGLRPQRIQPQTFDDGKKKTTTGRLWNHPKRKETQNEVTDQRYMSNACKVDSFTEIIH